MMDKRKAYEEKLDTQFKKWGAELALFSAKADKAKAEAKVEYFKTIKTLQGKREAAGAKLQALKNAGDESWEDLKVGAEKAWADVRTAFHEAASRFK
jgi:predicted ATP-binding protein involved in virulence